MKISGIKDSDMSIHTYSHLMVDKGAKNHTLRKDSLFNKWYWEKWISTCRQLKLDPYLPPCTKIASKWMKDLNERPKTLKLLQENIGETHQNISISNNFLNRTTTAQEMTARVVKRDCIKLKSFCTSKEIISILKRKHTEWEKLFSSYSSNN
jgi:hypothetical protein